MACLCSLALLGVQCGCPVYMVMGVYGIHGGALVYWNCRVECR